MESIESIRGFAGEAEAAVVPAKVQEMMVEYDHVVDITRSSYERPIVKVRRMASELRVRVPVRKRRPLDEMADG